MTDISVGVQNWGMFSLNFKIGKKDSSPHVYMAGRLDVILGAAEEMHVYLYDVAYKRAWLISGTELLLYLVHLKHRKKPYLIQGKAAELVFAEPSYDGSAACKKALLQMASVPLFNDIAVDKEDLCVKHLVRQLWERLQPLEGEADEDGISMKMSLSTKLKGNEIMDLVLDKKLHTVEVALENTNGGWPDLVKATDAVILIGSHLGELIKPVLDTNKLCSPWVSLPDSKDYLATTTHKLLQIFGKPDENGHLSLPGLRVHKSALLFEDCPDKLKPQCRCERLQQIIFRSRLSVISVNPPGPCPKQGCVIIGRAPKVLRSLRSRSKQALFYLPNSQILPESRDSPCQTPSDSEEDRSSWSSRMPDLDVTLTTPISQDSCQNDETFSKSNYALNKKTSVPTTGKYSEGIASTFGQHLAQSPELSRTPLSPRQNMYQQGSDSGYQAAKSHELSYCSQSLTSTIASTSRPETSSTIRTSLKLDSLNQESMQDISGAETRTLLNCEHNVSSDSTYGKPVLFEARYAYPAVNPKATRRLRRMPHLDLKKKAVQGITEMQL
jgi:hypothetical protein